MPNKFNLTRTVVQVFSQDGSVSVPVEVVIQGGTITFRTHAEKGSVGEELGIEALEALSEELSKMEIEHAPYKRNFGHDGVNRIDDVVIPLKRSGK